jgi:hypothetical protein
MHDETDSCIEYKLWCEFSVILPGFPENSGNFFKYDADKKFSPSQFSEQLSLMRAWAGVPEHIPSSLSFSFGKTYLFTVQLLKITK